jgi:hypothetical protein
LSFANFVVGDAKLSVLPAVPATKTEPIAKCAARFVVRKQHALHAKPTQNPMREKRITAITNGPIALEKVRHHSKQPSCRGVFLVTLLHKV